MHLEQNTAHAILAGYPGMGVRYFCLRVLLADPPLLKNIITCCVCCDSAERLPRLSPRRSAAGTTLA